MPAGASWGAVWRGGADGHAVGRDGAVDPAMTAKYRGELRYWVRAVRGEDPEHGAAFPEVFATWQRTRLNELADRLGIDRGTHRGGHERVTSEREHGLRDLEVNGLRRRTR